MKLTLQEKAQRHHEKTTAALRPIGLAAALKHPRAKQWAKVNCEDNFSLAIYGTVHDAVLGEISDFLIPDDVEWFNNMCRSGYSSSIMGSSEFNKFIVDICREAYQTLHKPSMITKRIFKQETGLVDDVLDRAWADFNLQPKTFAAWWAVSQGRYV